MSESCLRCVVVSCDCFVCVYYFLGGGQTLFGIIDIYFIIYTGTYCVCPCISEDRPKEICPHQISGKSPLVEVGRHLLHGILHLHALVG